MKDPVLLLNLQILPCSYAFFIQAESSGGGSSGTSSTTPHAKARKQDLKGLSNSHRDGASAATVPKGEQRQAHLVKVRYSIY